MGFVSTILMAAADRRPERLGKNSMGAVMSHLSRPHPPERQARDRLRSR